VETVVFQSHSPRGVPAWIQTCLRSVRDWAAGCGHGYRCFGDEIFGRLPPGFRDKTAGRPSTQADLGRLLLARELLEEVERVIWLDADVLVFAPGGLDCDIPSPYAFGREIWVQEDSRGGLRAYRNVHNAVCLFERHNPFLEFYIHSAERLVTLNDGGFPPQFIGPKFLTAQHNIMKLPLIETLGMASPLVLRDLAGGSGEALDLQRAEQPRPLAAVNLCSSLAVDDRLLARVCSILLDSGRF
jgi:hypothetical protein